MTVYVAICLDQHGNRRAFYSEHSIDECGVIRYKAQFYLVLNVSLFFDESAEFVIDATGAQKANAVYSLTYSDRSEGGADNDLF